jgi:hypothetical protein
LDHLVRTEVEIQNAAARGLSEPHRIRLADRVRTRFLIAVFKSDRKVKVPARAKQVLPGADLDLPAVRHRWDVSREQLAHFLETIPPARLSAGIFQHPVGGWMTVGGILDFFLVHIIHHEYQLTRIAAQSAPGRDGTPREPFDALRKR